MKHFIITIAMLAAIGLAAWSQGGNKILWMQNFEGMVWDCAFMPDEDYIIVAHDTLLEVRRTVDQSLVRAKNFSPKVIYSFDVSKDGRYVAIGGSGGKIKLLDINTFDILKEYEEESAFSVNFSPDGKMLAFADGDSAIVVDVVTGKRLFKTYGTQQDQCVNEAIFSPDGKWLACDYRGGTDKKIYVFDTETWKVYAVFNDDDFTPNGAEGFKLFFSPNSELLMADRPQGYIKIWEIITKNELVAINLKNFFGYPMIIFKDNRTLLLKNTGEKISFYDIILKKIIKEISVGIFGVANNVLNRDETLLLGDKLGLMQIDLSILSTPENNSKEKEEIIYPNPTTGEIQVNINLPYNALLDVNIIDLSGKIINKISSEMVPSGKFEKSYNVSYLPSGVYLLKFTQRDFEYTFKLVKEGK